MGQRMAINWTLFVYFTTSIMEEKEEVVQHPDIETNTEEIAADRKEEDKEVKHLLHMRSRNKKDPNRQTVRKGRREVGELSEGRRCD